VKQCRACFDPKCYRGKAKRLWIEWLASEAGQAAQAESKRRNVTLIPQDYHYYFDCFCRPECEKYPKGRGVQVELLEDGTAGEIEWDAIRCLKGEKCPVRSKLSAEEIEALEQVQESVEEKQVQNQVVEVLHPTKPVPVLLWRDLLLAEIRRELGNVPAVRLLIDQGMEVKLKKRQTDPLKVVMALSHQERFKVVETFLAKRVEKAETESRTGALVEWLQRMVLAVYLVSR